MPLEKYEHPEGRLFSITGLADIMDRCRYISARGELCFVWNEAMEIFISSSRLAIMRRGETDINLAVCEYVTKKSNGCDSWLPQHNGVVDNNNVYPSHQTIAVELIDRCCLKAVKEGR